MNNEMIKKAENILKDSLTADNENTALRKSERILSVGTGIFITLSGLVRLFSNPLLAITELGVGALLLDRGISGHCIVKGISEEQGPGTSVSTANPMTSG